MEKATQLLKFKEQGKFLLVLPLLVLPFITMLFWALGGGEGSETFAQRKQPAGLNPELPKAYFKEDKSLSKFSFYKKAELDSARFKEQIKNDPYYSHEAMLEDETMEFPPYDPLPPQSVRTKATAYRDPNEEKVYRKVAQLNEQLQIAASPANNLPQKPIPFERKKAAIESEDVNRLENMMQLMRGGSDSEDPEVQQLNGLLEKILDVQHPERVKERSQQEAFLRDKAGAAAFETKGLTGKDTTKREAGKGNSGNPSGFFGISRKDNNSRQNVIVAVVQEDQTLVSGGIVKLRLMQDLSVQSNVIPKGQLVYGVAQLNDERLQINITSVRFETIIYPVKLQVYDFDGLEGIYVPGAIGRDVAKQSATSALQSMELMTMDRSLSAQAATAGVNAAKSLFTRKVKQVRVTLKAGYQVLLKDKE